MVEAQPEASQMMRWCPHPGQLDKHATKVTAILTHTNVAFKQALFIPVFGKPVVSDIMVGLRVLTCRQYLSCWVVFQMFGEDQQLVGDSGATVSLPLISFHGLKRSLVNVKTYLATIVAPLTYGCGTFLDSSLLTCLNKKYIYLINQLVGRLAHKKET